jgi:hypothetical protein
MQDAIWLSMTAIANANARSVACSCFIDDVQDADPQVLVDGASAGEGLEGFDG